MKFPIKVSLKVENPYGQELMMNGIKLSIHGTILKSEEELEKIQKAFGHLIIQGIEEVEKDITNEVKKTEDKIKDEVIKVEEMIEGKKGKRSKEENTTSTSLNTAQPEA